MGGFSAAFSDLTKEEEHDIDDYLRKKGLPTYMNVTFANIVQPERYSDIWSRSDIEDFTACLAGDAHLKTPLVSANMSSVTGVELAVAMAREGGFGFIPQMVDIDERVQMIKRIRRSNAAFIEEPYTIHPERTLREAKQVMALHYVHTLIVVDDASRPLGVLSNRDWRYEKDETTQVYNLLPPRQVITAPCDTSLEQAALILRRHRIEKLPLTDAEGRLAGLITAHGLFYKMRHPWATRDGRGRFLVAGSIGVIKDRNLSDRGDILREVERQLEAGASVLLIDTARAFSVNMVATLRGVKTEHPTLPVIAGNVSTPEGAKFLFELGADCVKVGQGSGSRCLTRRVGTGVPQVTAIAKCSVIARKYEKTIMADGGMKTPGDFASAVIAGAHTTMSGAAFVITDESAAIARPDKNGVKKKMYQGSASFTEQEKRLAEGNLDRMRRPEGFEDPVYVVGSLKERFEDLLGGFRSAMSYCGVRTLDELRDKAVFELQSAAGRFEGLKE